MASDPVQRVVFAAPMPDRLVLDPPSAFIELRVGQLHEVKRIGYLDDMIQRVVKHLAVRTRQIQSTRGSLPPAQIRSALKAIAEPAGVLVAYLHRLEQGVVANPSPHILHRLPEVVGAPYAELMELVG